MDCRSNSFAIFEPENGIISKMRKTELFAVILLMWAMQVVARPSPPASREVPRVVLGIVVENMRPDYIDRYWDKFGDGGFRKLVNGGSLCTGFRFSQHILNNATGTATLFTGVTPSVHGIIDESWYDRDKGKVTGAVADEEYPATGGAPSGSRVSPRQLRSSTLGDQLKLSGNGKPKVFSIALNEAPALFAAGFSGDAAWWFDTASGKMITSSFYLTSQPDWAEKFNARGEAQKYGSRNWVLLKNASDYSASHEDRSPYELGFGGGKNFFPHSMASLVKNAGHFGPLKSTPFGNSLVGDFARELLENEKVGEDDQTDLVTVIFSSMDQENSAFGPASVEMEDLYLRLDEEIAALISLAEKKYGTEHLLVFLTANSSAAYPVNYLKEKMRFPAGTFTPDNAIALLNSFLNISYGDLKWIEYNNGLQLYLNHKIAGINKTDLREMRSRAATFLSEFEGIKMAVSSDQIREGQLSHSSREGVTNSWHEGRSGDILLVLREGWQPAFKFKKVHYSGHGHVPLIFYGSGIAPRRLYENVDATSLVPTLTVLLGIPVPPGCTAPPVLLMRE